MEDGKGTGEGWIWDGRGGQFAHEESYLPQSYLPRKDDLLLMPRCQGEINTQKGNRTES